MKLKIISIKFFLATTIISIWLGISVIHFSSSFIRTSTGSDRNNKTNTEATELIANSDSDSLVSKDETLSPIRLTIPKIGVDSAIEYVGIDASGAMEVPKSPLNVAWLERGGLPGEVGTAVMAGHYGRNNGNESVFDNLHKLRAGDKVLIQNSKGDNISFIVSGSRRYDPKIDAARVFLSNDGRSHLNLITCEGIWSKDDESYTDRLVVFTYKEFE